MVENGWQKIWQEHRFYNKKTERYDFKSLRMDFLARYK
jgi:hypothetical protein